MGLKETVRIKLYNFITSIKKAAVIIGSVLIVFAALRNSLTWHMQHIWGASHDFWQKQWIRVLDFTGGDELLIYVAAPWIISVVPFWLFNLIFLAMDLTGKPAFLRQYKIQDDKTEKLTWAQAKRTILVVVRNQLLNIPCLLLFHPISKWRGLIKHGPDLPTFQWVLVELMVFLFIEEILFYYSHRSLISLVLAFKVVNAEKVWTRMAWFWNNRLLHHPLIYKHVHKIHHEWTAPISIASIYCHPLEFYFSNSIPVLIGPLVYGSHVCTSYLWVLLATTNTVNAHSGYHLPSFPSNEAHDFHHLKFNEMYGVLGILDRLHNTDAKFRASKQYERHVHFFSLTPIKKLIPDTRQHSKSPACAPGCSKQD